MKTYRVKEVFRTLQGEGFHAGRPAVFVRFAGCNLWTGNEATRMRDAKRTDSACPIWCDTDFVSGKTMTASQILDEMVGVGYDDTDDIVVFTGGEPMLQLDKRLIEEVDGYCTVETNGTVPNNEVLEALDWVCISPKTPPARVRVYNADEVKVVYPGSIVLPDVYMQTIDAKHWYIQPCDSPVCEDGASQAVRYVMENNGWTLSIQMHKSLNLP